MANILLVSNTKNFIVSSFISQLEEMEHRVIHASSSMSEMGSINVDIDLMLIFAEELATDGLVYLKDKAIEDSIPVFVVGDVNELESVQAVIPKQFIKKEVLRPVNVKEVVENIDVFLKENSAELKKKILVVDDSGTVLRSVKAWLENKYQVILANSGAMAIKYLAMNRPDLVLLDYAMPICDGKQVLEMIRSEIEFSNIPVIFLTSKNDRESVMSVSALKPQGYLLKTMEPQQIIQFIDDFFEKSKAMDI